jgi:hypothetical protein
MSIDREVLSFLGNHDGFVLRTCPRCGRDFQTWLSPSDIVVFSEACATLGRWANAAELAAPPIALRCIYCRHRAKASGFQSALQLREAEKLTAAWAEQVRFLRLRHVLDSLSVNPRPTFLLLRPAAPRLQCSDSSDDFAYRSYGCCGVEFRGMSNWSRGVFCPGCGKPCGDWNHDDPGVHTEPN